MEKLTDKDFDQMYALLQQSFIKDELRPYEAQKALFQEPLYHVFAEREADGEQMIAFIAVWDFTDFVFIDYFAVHPAFRNRRLGEKMLQDLAHLTPKDICLEIETPRDELTFRRLHFYQRNHFVLCPFNYKQPPIAKGNAPVSLSLMSTQKITDKDDFERICKEIDVYAFKRFN